MKRNQFDVEMTSPQHQFRDIDAKNEKKVILGPRIRIRPEQWTPT